MTIAELLLLLLIAFVISTGLTWVVKKHAIAAARLDEPNYRSSHTVPTPTGGGLSIVVIVLATALWQFSISLNSNLLALIVGGSCLAFIGWWDDRSPISSKVRLAIQLIVCGGVLHFANPLELESTNLWLATTLLTLPAAWLVNLYNFMDGTDGLVLPQFGGI